MTAAVRRLPTVPSAVAAARESQPVQLTGTQRKKAQALAAVMSHVRRLRAERRLDSLNAAIEAFAGQYADGTLPGAVTAALDVLRPGKRTPPNRATLHRWDARYTAQLAGDTTAAAPRHRGRPRKDYGWEARALHLYALPSKPDMATVAKWLRDEGWDSATESRVRRYLKSLPADAADRGRLGARLYNATRKPFIRRDTDVLPVGYIYQGDGHTVDTYVAHPETGRIWRPELTVWMDVASRYIPGWYISEAESSISTLLALSHALVGQDHVPAYLHIDNGSGYASRMMSEASLGFYARFDIEPIFALPYNAKAKGQVERWFGTMERDFGKRQETYCGADMAPEVLNRVTREVNAGKRRLPELREYMAGLAAFIERYHNTPHSALGGRTPAEVWATLERVQLGTPADAVVRARVTRRVQREAVRLHNREYMHGELAAWNGRDVVIEYDLHDDSQVRVLDDSQRWICDAGLVHKRAYLPESRIQEGRMRRLDGQRKRLARRLDEAEARAGQGITHDQVLERMAELERPAAGGLEKKTGSTLADVLPAESGSEIELDILNTDY